MLKVIVRGDDPFYITDDGHIKGRNRRIQGAIVLDRTGKKVSAYFTRQILNDPASIEWLFEDGSQRVYLYDQEGRIPGSYTVEKDDGTKSLFE